MPSIYVSFDNKAMNKYLTETLGNKAKMLDEDMDLRNAAAGQYAAYVSKYVPLGKTGRLRQAKVKDGEVRYSAIAIKKDGTRYDYAETQYNGPDWWERRTPGTYSHWNRHMTTAERQAFYDDVKQMLLEKMNK